MTGDDIDTSRVSARQTLSDSSASGVSEGIHTEFIRLPKNGNCSWTGLSRAKLNELILPCERNNYRPPVKSVSLRKSGATKGTRLIYLPSLLGYLHSQMEREQGGPTEFGHGQSNQDKHGQIPATRVSESGNKSTNM
jgi:hypothetical protein